MLGTIKLRLRSYSQTIDSQIYSNAIRSWFCFRSNKFKSYIKKPATFMTDKTGRTVFAIDELLVKLTEIQNYLNSALKSAEASNFIDKINSAGFFIITDRTKFRYRFRNFLPFSSPLIKRPQNFTSLLPSLYEDVSGKFSFCSQKIVGSVVNLSHACSVIIPAVINARIKSISKFSRSLKQETLLFFCWLYFDTYCSIQLFIPSCGYNYSIFLTFCRERKINETIILNTLQRWKS